MHNLLVPSQMVLIVRVNHLAGSPGLSTWVVRPEYPTQYAAERKAAGAHLSYN